MEWKSLSLARLASRLSYDAIMPGVDRHEISFQCPRCGHELHETIGGLKANRRMECEDCGIGISFDTDRLVHAADELLTALPPETVPNEITIKFFRER